MGYNVALHVQNIICLLSGALFKLYAQQVGNVETAKNLSALNLPVLSTFLLRQPQILCRLCVSMLRLNVFHKML